MWELRSSRDSLHRRQMSMARLNVRVQRRAACGASVCNAWLADIVFPIFVAATILELLHEPGPLSKRVIKVHSGKAKKLLHSSTPSGLGQASVALQSNKFLS